LSLPVLQPAIDYIHYHHLVLLGQKSDTQLLSNREQQRQGRESTSIGK